ncbi:MAG: hypothetical protein GTO45_24215, partial [Candidatus Aminicenantes bacterium]|nr:hypothetical protein [Candidatus Aminicenantes bacterium]NIM81858.1 hypothetical protein [Candidatus Aminicenantes bacterium]NIN21235.1 hypothetical protein [Candidatus Aminicenantes bacterium]NIN45056.1 hypothetical protein [Candidatus Aminicenantes bacterium]NIN87873.1 hypothetical protein [Candidatus Aminicenantes bacterium]
MSDTNENNKVYGVSQFKRNRYFYGKLLSVMDFEDEQRYMNNKRHLLNRMINGFGIVCGLADVEIFAEDGNIKIQFNSGGMVIDRWGREIVVPVGKEKDVLLEGPAETPLTASLMGDSTYYLYLEYKEREGELVRSALENTGSQESCTPSRIIEDFRVVASDKEPVIPTISCPATFGDITADDARQKVREWLREKTSNYCTEPGENRVFILALNKITSDDNIVKVVIDWGGTANYVSFVANNRVLSELLACHLADFTNPHKTKHSDIVDVLAVEPETAGTDRVKHVSNEDAGNWNTAFVHSNVTDSNPHQTKHSDIANVLAIDPDTPDPDRVKHVSNDDAKNWNLAFDHSIVTDSNPHQTKHSDIANVLA